MGNEIGCVKEKQTYVFEFIRKKPMLSFFSNFANEQ